MARLARGLVMETRQREFVTAAVATGVTQERGVLTLGGVPLDRLLSALRRLEPDATACWVYDLDQIESLSPPFEMVDAHSLLANWLDRDASVTTDRDFSERRAA